MARAQYSLLCLCENAYKNVEQGLTRTKTHQSKSVSAESHLPRKLLGQATWLRIRSRLTLFGISLHRGSSGLIRQCFQHSFQTGLSTAIPRAYALDSSGFSSSRIRKSCVRGSPRPELMPPGKLIGTRRVGADARHNLPRGPSASLAYLPPGSL